MKPKQRVGCNNSLRVRINGPPCVSSSAVLAADSSGDGGVPEEAWRVLRGSEAVPEERLRSERLLSVSLITAPHFYNCFAAQSGTVTLLNI